MAAIPGMKLMLEIHWSQPNIDTRFRCSIWSNTLKPYCSAHWRHCHHSAIPLLFLHFPSRVWHKRFQYIDIKFKLKIQAGCGVKTLHCGIARTIRCLFDSATLIQLYRQPTRCNNNCLLIIPTSSTCFGRWFRPSSRTIDCVHSLWFNAPTMLPASNIVGALYHQVWTQSNALDDGQNHRPKHVELIEIINKPLLLHLIGCLYYWRIIGFEWLLKTKIRRVHEIAKSDYGLRHVCTSVCPHGTSRHALDGFSRNFMFEDFSKMCRENQVYLKSVKHKVQFTWRRISVYDHISLKCS